MADAPRAGSAARQRRQPLNLLPAEPAHSDFDLKSEDWHMYEDFYTRPIQIDPWYEPLLRCCRRKTNRNCRRCVGSGGSAKVYVSTLESGEKAIVKVIHPSWRSSFLREAKVLETLSKEHGEKELAPSFYASAHDSKNNFYLIIMEYIEGVSLYGYLTMDPTPMKEEKEEVFEDLQEKIAALHKAGYVHFDLKPENILVLLDGIQYKGVRIIDFGSAQKIGDPYVQYPETLGFSLSRNIYNFHDIVTSNNPNYANENYIIKKEQKITRSLSKLLGEDKIKELREVGIPPHIYFGLRKNDGIFPVHPEFNLYSLAEISRRMGLSKGGGQRRTRRRSRQ